MSSEPIIELENQKTGNTRKFPKSIYDALLDLCLQMLPPNQRERAEGQLMGMLAEYLDTNAAAEPLLLAAEALYPEMKGEIRFNEFSTEAIVIKIKTWANMIFQRYGHPVMLVGSAVTGLGRDVDIRVMIPDPEFDARFPDEGALSLEIGKQSRMAALFLRMNVDFRLQKVSEAYVHQGKPTMRLDTALYPEAYEPPASGIGGEG